MITTISAFVTLALGGTKMINKKNICQPSKAIHCFLALATLFSILLLKPSDNNLTKQCFERLKKVLPLGPTFKRKPLNEQL